MAQPSLHDLRLIDDHLHAPLKDFETFWRDIQPFLCTKGYALRPRYQQDWIPSWRTKGTWPSNCEDGIVSPTFGRVMDALRVRDRTRVAIKRLKKSAPGREEIAIMQYFSSEPRRSDRRNRCAPLLDLLDPGDDCQYYLVVIPLMQHMDRPDDFANVSEALEFCHQVLEGLAFMHEHHVEHRDCCRGNIMMDGEALYPKGRHPAKPTESPDYSQQASSLRRSDIPIKYYFIDFGHAIQFDSWESRRPVLRPFGQDKTAPELQTREPTNGFQLDVYCVGNMFREELLWRFPKLRSILGGLIEEMTGILPEKRPTSSEANARLDEIRGRLTSWQLSGRLAAPPNEQLSSRILNEAGYRYGNVKRLFWRNQAKRSSKFRDYAHIPYRLPSDDGSLAGHVTPRAESDPILP